MMYSMFFYWAKSFCSLHWTNLKSFYKTLFFFLLFLSFYEKQMQTRKRKLDERLQFVIQFIFIFLLITRICIVTQIFYKDIYYNLQTIKFIQSMINIYKN